MTYEVSVAVETARRDASGPTPSRRHGSRPYVRRAATTDVPPQCCSSRRRAAAPCPGHLDAPPGEVRRPVDDGHRATSTRRSTNVNDDTFFLRDSTGTRVASRPSRRRTAARPIVLTPHAPLARSMRYTATLTSGHHRHDPRHEPDLPAGVELHDGCRATPRHPRRSSPSTGSGRRPAFFGHNAPRWASLPKPEQRTKRDGDPWEYSWDDPPRSVWVDSQGSSLGGDTVHLDREVQDLEPRGWAIFETATGAGRLLRHQRRRRSRSPTTAISGRVVAARAVPARRQLAVRGRGRAARLPRPRDRRPRAAASACELVELPIETPLKAGDTRDRARQHGPRPRDAGRLIALRGELVDLPGAIGDEILVVEDVAPRRRLHDAASSKPGSKRSYVRKTVTMNANVVRGHARRDGRPRGPRRRRRLAGQPALRAAPAAAHVRLGADARAARRARSRSASTACAGTRRPVLYGLGPRSRSYIVRRSDDGVASVIFGDGEQGARPPTGTENIVATYRTGIGRAGTGRRRPADAAARASARHRRASRTRCRPPAPPTRRHRDAAARERAADRADDGADRLAARLRGLRARRSRASARPRRSRSGAATRQRRARDRRGGGRRGIRRELAAVHQPRRRRSHAAREPGLDVEVALVPAALTSTSRPRSASIPAYRRRRTCSTPRASRCSTAFSFDAPHVRPAGHRGRGRRGRRRRCRAWWRPTSRSLYQLDRATSRSPLGSERRASARAGPVRAAGRARRAPRSSRPSCCWSTRPA